MKIILKQQQCFTIIMTLCLVSVALFAVSGCNKTENSDENDSYFYAKVENASKFSNVVEVKLMTNTIIPMAQYYDDVEIASFDWNDDSFTIELPKTVNSNYLYQLICDDRWFIRLSTFSYRESLTATTISNKNVKTVSTELCGFDKNGYLVATFSLGKKKDEDNYTKVIFTYVDSDITVLGNNIERNNLGNPPFEIHNIYSIEWKKGWNVWYFSTSQTVAGDGTPIITWQWSSTSINGLKWYGEEPVMRL